MDPRVAWIQPEQKGPANALWMQVWETSQGVRLFSPQQQQPPPYHNQNQCVNHSALDLLKNVAPGRSACSGHRIIVNGTAVSSLGRSLSSGNANDPFAGGGKAPAHKPASSSDSGTESPPSGCPLERTPGGIARGDKHTAPGDNLDNNHANLYPRHPHLQPAWLSRGQQQVQPCPGPVSHAHGHHPGRRKSDNKASTYGMNYLLASCASASTPWKARGYSPGLLG